MFWKKKKKPRTNVFKRYTVEDQKGNLVAHIHAASMEDARAIAVAKGLLRGVK